MKALLSAAVLIFAAILPGPAQQSIPEPDTVFYGRILNQSSGHGYLVTEGTLTFSVTRPGNTALTLATELEPLANGLYSYQLKVPHEALSTGLTVSSTSVALTGQPVTNQVLTASLNGHPAALLGPGGKSFDLSQALRASTFRLDFSVGYTLPDSDGDGMADWWESLHGLDLNVSGDAALDPDHDGRSNLQEYLAGTDPNFDNRGPELLTKEIVAHAGCTAYVTLEAADVDSAPANLTYTLTSLPEGGVLMLRNAQSAPANPDRPMEQGTTFTQADVISGKVVFIPTPDSEPTNFHVRVADENPDHAAAEGDVQILLFKPDPQAPSDDLHLAAHELGTTQHAIIADLSTTDGPHTITAPSSGLPAATYASSYQSAWGDDRPHFFLGGPGRDTLKGGMAADVLVGGAADDTLTGGGAADKFVLASVSDGTDTITDFHPAEGDAIDLTRVLSGTSHLLTDYVRITRDGADALLGIDAGGTGTAYASLTIRLANSSLTQADLPDLSDNGNLLTGVIGLPPRLTVLASATNAAENGPTPAQFTVSRTGSTTAALTVSFQISGSATNGVDYALIQPSLTIPAGQRSAVVSITPYADALVELNELVQLTLLASTSYTLGTAAVAQITIEDMKPEISIEAIEGLASLKDASPALLLVTRTGILDRSVFVRLTLGGTARNGVDYQRLNTYVNLAAGQTDALIEVTPLAGASLPGGAAGVIVTLTPNASYRIGNPGIATAIIVDEKLTLASWRNKVAPGSAVTPSAFATSDSVISGVPNLRTYALPKPPRFAIVEGHAQIEFDRVPAATDVEYIVECSEDLKNWRSGTLYAQPVTPSLPGASFLSSAFRSPNSTDSARANWMRVRVRLLP